ncbi:hypothetical protein PspTeo4_13576 [Pseudomonas sp. Teo4]|nr:hypothetical protein [Pseudomonas sp. Teo4]
MHTTLSNAQVLAHLGIELADYERLLGNMYDAALDTRRLNEALQQLRGLFGASYVTLILRVLDEPFLSPMMVAGDVEPGRVGSITMPTTTSPRCSTVCRSTRCSPSMN